MKHYDFVINITLPVNTKQIEDTYIMDTRFKWQKIFGAGLLGVNVRDIKFNIINETQNYHYFKDYIYFHNLIFTQITPTNAELPIYFPFSLPKEEIINENDILRVQLIIDTIDTMNDRPLQIVLSGVT